MQIGLRDAGETPRLAWLYLHGVIALQGMRSLAQRLQRAGDKLSWRCAIHHVLAAALLILATTPALADGVDGGALRNVLAEVEDLSSFFADLEGTFVLLDVEHHRIVRFNPQRAGVRLPPCSTFKIPNALIGLETGVLSGPGHAMKWDGTHYEIESWNQDQTLRTAISRSVVWYFQRVAAGVGEQRMRHFLREIPYGNEDISGGLTRFWLDSSLRISANEQVDLMRRLAAGALPFSSRSLNTVKDLIRLERTENGVLYGKTGTAGSSDSHPPLGWFVGYVDHSGAAYPFATNIQGTAAGGPKARDISERILHSKGLL